LAIVVASLAIPEFREVENFRNILKQSAVVGVLAIGATFVVIAGMVDLSIGVAAGLIVVLTCGLYAGGTLPTAPLIALMLVGGAVLGAMNGFLIEKLRVHSVIFTFAMMSILQGIILTYTDVTIGTAPEVLKALANSNVVGIPASALLLAALAVVAHVLLNKTRFGYHLKAAGGSPDSAERAGVQVSRIRIYVFAISGLTAAIAGLVLAGRLGTGYPLAGAGLELDAIVAVVLGGTLLTGGRGSVVNTVAAVLGLTIISNVLNLLQISSYVQIFVKGLIVVVAVVANQAGRK
jgi:ribose/xylose/arabinose/galactoside ABC-type transport system permease subunit